MTLDDMLLYCAAEFLNDRTELVSGDGDELWSDTYLCRMFNDAQNILCRRSWVIIENGVSPAGIVTLSTGKALYQLHKSLLYVFDATPVTQAAPLGRTTDAILREGNTYGADAFDIGEAAARAGAAYTGSPIAIATDAASRSMRISPTPTAAQNGVRVALKVARLPINYLSMDDTEASPEVPEEWHMAICEYAAGKALTLPNTDADQKPEGRRLLSQFDDVVRMARQERVRMEMDAGRWAFSSATAVV